MRSMNIQLASDLHLERLSGRFPSETLIRPAPQAELLVLAGDIAARTDGVHLFAEWPVPVLYVPGNHEFFDADWERTRDEMRRAAEGTQVTVLDGEEVEFRGLRCLGCTLWTDYALQQGLDPREQMQACARRMRDHAVIRVGSRGFAPEDALAEHLRCRAWLEQALSRPFEGPTVVVTHHAPSARSVHPRFADHPVNPAYASRLEPLLARAQVWLHGHVHDSFDYRVHGEGGASCRVVANPRGNARRIDQARNLAELEFENPAFQPQCLIEL